MSWTLHRGDCIEGMRTLEPDSIDSIVCDPPYGIGFMGKEWDGKAIADAAAQDRERRKDLGGHSASRPGREQPRSSSAFGNEAVIAGPVEGGAAFQEWCREWAAEALRVLKPGGHLLAFGSTRTYHRLASGIEDAGFEVRDSIAWIYGTGFPKNHNVGKAIDRHLGAPVSADDAEGPVTPEGKAHAGEGTALKPALEPVVVARKPLDGTIARTVLQHGTGTLQIDATRVEMSPEDAERIENMGGFGRAEGFVPNAVYNEMGGTDSAAHEGGRWPANVILDPEAAEALDGQSGETTSAGGRIGKKEQGAVSIGAAGTYEAGDPGFGDTGGASRFFYVAKATTAERNAGLSAWDSKVCSCPERQDPEASPRRATSEPIEAADSASSTAGSGSSTTDRSPRATRSTTGTGSRPTTESATLNSSPPSTTSGSTPTTTGEPPTEAGSATAQSAGDGSPRPTNTSTPTSEAGFSTGDAGPATSGESSKPSGSVGSGSNRCPDCGGVVRGARRNSHPT